MDCGRHPGAVGYGLPAAVTRPRLPGKVKIRSTRYPFCAGQGDDELERGVNLATRVDNPFAPAFNSVMEAVLAKQNFETKQIKSIFHGEEGRKDIEAAATRTEAERAPLAEAIRRAMVPVEHELKVEGVN